MATQSFEIPNEVRDYAEKAVDQARTAVSSLMGNALKVAEQVQSSGQTFQSNLQAAVSKGFDHAQTNTNTAFDFAHKLVRTKDLREAFELQSEFVRSQIATLQEQAKELGSLAAKSTGH